MTLSLETRIEVLENDLKSEPPRISVHEDLPFAIFRYAPSEEWEMRRNAKLLSTRLNEIGKKTTTINLSDILWQIIDECEGLKPIVELEKSKGFLAAQRQLTTYLSDVEWRPLATVLEERLNALKEQFDIVFLMRTASMAPAIYHMSKLLDQMKGKTQLMLILFTQVHLRELWGCVLWILKIEMRLGTIE